MDKFNENKKGGSGAILQLVAVGQIENSMNNTYFKNKFDKDQFDKYINYMINGDDNQYPPSFPFYKKLPNKSYSIEACPLENNKLVISGFEVGGRSDKYDLNCLVIESAQLNHSKILDNIKYINLYIDTNPKIYLYRIPNWQLIYFIKTENSVKDIDGKTILNLDFIKYKHSCLHINKEKYGGSYGHGQEDFSQFKLIFEVEYKIPFNNTTCLYIKHQFIDTEGRDKLANKTIKPFETYEADSFILTSSLEQQITLNNFILVASCIIFDFGLNGFQNLEQLSMDLNGHQLFSLTNFDIQMFGKVYDNRFVEVPFNFDTDGVVKGKKYSKYGCGLNFYRIDNPNVKFKFKEILTNKYAKYVNVGIKALNIMYISHGIIYPQKRISCYNSPELENDDNDNYDLVDEDDEQTTMFITELLNKEIII
jgi:hypothetical protein